MLATEATAQQVQQAHQSAKREGSIADAFVSLSGSQRQPLPDRFRQLKCDLVKGREKQISASWTRLLRELKKENEIIAKKGCQIIPQIEFSELENGSHSLKAEIQKRGAVVVKGVIPEQEARAYKSQVEEYVKKNPSTKGNQHPIPFRCIAVFLNSLVCSWFHRF